MTPSAKSWEIADKLVLEPHAEHCLRHWEVSNQCMCDRSISVDRIAAVLDEAQLEDRLDRLEDDILQRLRQALAGKSALWPFVDDYPLILDAIKELEHMRRAVDASESRAVAAECLVLSHEDRLERLTDEIELRCVSLICPSCADRTVSPAIRTEMPARGPLWAHNGKLCWAHRIHEARWQRGKE